MRQKNPNDQKIRMHARDQAEHLKKEVSNLAHMSVEIIDIFDVRKRVTRTYRPEFGRYVQYYRGTPREPRRSKWCTLLEKNPRLETL